MEPVGSMPHSQGLSNNSYPEPNQGNIFYTQIKILILGFKPMFTIITFREFCNSDVL